MRASYDAVEPDFMTHTSKSGSSKETGRARVYDPGPT